MSLFLSLPHTLTGASFVHLCATLQKIESPIIHNKILSNLPTFDLQSASQKYNHVENE